MTELWNAIGAVANAVAVVVAMISVIVTVHEQKRIRTDEKNKTSISQKMLWYNQLVLEDVMKRLTMALEHIDRIINEQGIESELNDDDGQELYRKIEFEFQIVAETFMAIKIFNNSLYQDCKFLLDSILDDYSDIVTTLTNSQLVENNKFSDVQNSRVEIMMKLYDHGKQMVSY